MKPDLDLILRSAETKLRKASDTKITKDDLKAALSELRAAWNAGGDGVEEFLAAREIAEHVEE